jgi:hypothetical protein
MNRDRSDHARQRGGDDDDDDDNDDGDDPDWTNDDDDDDDNEVIEARRGAFGVCFVMQRGALARVQG